MRLRKLALALGLASLAACGDDPVSVELLGDYVAVVFTATPTGQTPIDVLAAGGSLNIALYSDSTTTGMLVVPASANNGVALNESMAGTFTRVGNTVTFDQAADTFVRDMDFTISGRAMGGTHDFGNVTITVNLILP